MRENSFTRRRFLTGVGSIAIGTALGQKAHATASSETSAAQPNFTFVHITDPHIQPELGAVRGVAKAFKAIRALPEKPEFALVGGDLVMDATQVEPKRANQVYDLWQQAAADLKLPQYYTMGNHDLYALRETGKPGQDPEYGKGLWKRRLGLDRTYSFFDHLGWRFVQLDSAQITPEGSWQGDIDPTQLKWLDDLLRQTPRTMPMVFLTHFPIFTIYGQYTAGSTTALSAGMIVQNGLTFKEMIQRHRVKAVFQGHTHVVEECIYEGVHYITGGAICGDWWKGPRLGVHPEGFIVATVSGDNLVWRYVSYDWDAVREAAKG